MKRNLLCTLLISAIMTTTVLGAADGITSNPTSGSKLSKSDAEWVQVEEKNGTGDKWIYENELDKQEEEVTQSQKPIQTNPIAVEKETETTTAKQIEKSVSEKSYSNNAPYKIIQVPMGKSEIYINGEMMYTDAPAYIQKSSSSVMVPLRFVSVAFIDGESSKSADETSKVVWDANTKTATILFSLKNGQKIVQFQVGNPTVIIDGTSAVKMANGVVPEIVDGRMYVPFRAMGEAIGCDVTWNADAKVAVYKIYQ